jgi:adenosylhomocysteine nucleosidase
MAAGSGLLATIEAKRALYAQTEALAVDLESGVLAEAAQAASLPFVIIRAVADPSGRALPKAAQIPLTSSGTPNLPAILGSVLRSPGQIPGLLALGLEMNRAMASLREAAAAFQTR